MDFAETEDQKMIRDMVRDFAETVAGPTCNQRDKEQKPPIEEFKQFAELGVAGMTIPEEYGGQKLDDISEAIEEAVGTYHFDEVDDYDIELEMDYDGRVSLSSINLNESYRLVERIVEKVHSLFKEADAPEETEDA